MVEVALRWSSDQYSDAVTSFANGNYSILLLLHFSLLFFTLLLFLSIFILPYAVLRCTVLHCSVCNISVIDIYCTAHYGFELYCVMSCRIVLYRIVSYRIVQITCCSTCCAVPYWFLVYRYVLYCAMLIYVCIYTWYWPNWAILYFNLYKLCCTVLYWNVLNEFMEFHEIFLSSWFIIFTSKGIRTSDGGSHLDGLKTAVTRTINASARKVLASYQLY